VAGRPGVGQLVEQLGTADERLGEAVGAREEREHAPEERRLLAEALHPEAFA